MAGRWSSGPRGSCNRKWPRRCNAARNSIVNTRQRTRRGCSKLRGQAARLFNLRRNGASPASPTPRDGPVRSTANPRIFNIQACASQSSMTARAFPGLLAGRLRLRRSPPNLPWCWLPKPPSLCPMSSTAARHLWRKQFARLARVPSDPAREGNRGERPALSPNDWCPALNAPAVDRRLRRQCDVIAVGTASRHSAAQWGRQLPACRASPAGRPAGVLVPGRGRNPRMAQRQAFVFDDIIEHEAANPTHRLRVVMIFDCWHPDLGPQERTAIAAAVGGSEVAGF